MRPQRRGYRINPASWKLKYTLFATMISCDAILIAAYGWIVSQVAAVCGGEAGIATGRAQPVSSRRGVEPGKGSAHETSFLGTANYACRLS